MRAVVTETSFVRAIRRYMEIHGLNQEGFANRVEVDPSNVSKWLSGRGQRQDSVELVSAKLGMEPWEFLAYASNKNHEEDILPPRIREFARKIANLPETRQRALLTFVETLNPNPAMNGKAAPRERHLRGLPLGVAVGFP